MSPSPWLLAAALLFWGWHTGLWWLGVPLAGLISLPHLFDWHWRLEVKERQRTADLCSLLTVLAGLYLYFTEPRLGSAVILLLQWSPALLFPLAAAQIYGGRAGVEMSVLFLSLRGGRPGGDEPIDLRPLYLLICLLAAAMVAPDSRLYYPLLAALALWAMWPLRSNRRRSGVWLLGMSLAIVLGYGLSVGLQRAHGIVEEMVVDWLVGWFEHDTDPYKVKTAIGEIGDLKLSERILLRVRPEQTLKKPLLLRSASYNRYFRGTWLAGNRPFESLSLDERGWVLVDKKPVPEQVQISMEVKGRRGILPVPGGSRTLRGLEGATLSRNVFAAVKMSDAPALVQYQAGYGPVFDDLPPDVVDLRVSPEESALLEQLVGDWELSGLPPNEVLRRLQQRFMQHFGYSLHLEAAPRQQTALAHFLLETRTGHCEYFASAAALLLRAAGIPTRYALGWSVQEYSAIEQAYVARARHAHSWVLVWMDGAWRDFDPTPPDWMALEAQSRPFWGLIQDLWSRMRFLIAGGDGSLENWRTPLIGLLIPLLALLAWRVARRGRRIRQHRQDRPAAAPVSPFAAIEADFQRRGMGRHAAESLREWANRIEREGRVEAKALQTAIALHYRLQFDPKPCGDDEFQQLKKAFQNQLTQCREK